MLFIVADSLRYDFAEEYLFDKLFPVESHTELQVDAYPETFCTVPTLITGTKHQVHGSASAYDDPKITEPTLFDKYNKWVTVSRLLGSGPFYEIPAKKRVPNMFPSIRWNALSDNDNAVFKYAPDTSYDLVFYHSWLTHAPFGIANWCSMENKTLKDTDTLFGSSTLEENKERYKCGILSFRERIRLLREMCDRPFVITSDHGEFLGEEGNYGHGTEYYKNDNPAIKKVPLIVSEDVDLSDVNHQADVKELVWKLSDKE